MPSVFLHRASIVPVNLFIAATTHGPNGTGSTSAGGCQGLGGGGNGVLLFNGYNVSIMQNELSSRDLLYNIVPTVNTMVLCT